MATCKDCIHYDICLLGACVDGKTGACLKFTNKADVVEVVRCKDCIYYRIMGTGGFCGCGDKKTSYAADFYPERNDFCSYGVRKTEPTYCTDKENKLIHCEDCHRDCKG